MSEELNWPEDDFEAITSTAIDTDTHKQSGRTKHTIHKETHNRHVKGKRFEQDKDYLARLEYRHKSQKDKFNPLNDEITHSSYEDVASKDELNDPLLHAYQQKDLNTNNKRSVKDQMLRKILCCIPK